MKYKLIKDLPTFNKGDIFELRDGHLYLLETEDSSRHWKDKVMAYHRRTLEQFPNILEDWFEEIYEPDTVWHLQFGERYWFIDEYNHDIIICDTWRNEPDDYVRRDLGLAYISKREGELALGKMRAEVILKKDAGGFDPDWLNENQAKWYVSCVKGYLPSVEQTATVQRGLIHFASREDAQRSIDRHRKEWLEYFGVEG